MQIHQDYSIENTLPNFKSPFTSIQEDDYEILMSKKSTQVNDEVNILKAKLETKKLRLREMTKQFDSLCEENAHLKYKLNEYEKLKSKMGEKMEHLQHNSNQQYVERERELIENLHKLEEEVNFIFHS
jgi:hypothetical protein